MALSRPFSLVEYVVFLRRRYKDELVVGLVIVETVPNERDVFALSLSLSLSLSLVVRPAASFLFLWFVGFTCGCYFFFFCYAVLAQIKDQDLHRYLGLEPNEIKSMTR